MKYKILAVVVVVASALAHAWIDDEGSAWAMGPAVPSFPLPPPPPAPPAVPVTPAPLTPVSNAGGHGSGTYLSGKRAGYTQAGQ